MYLSYYQLKHRPFQISTDPGFLWLGEKHLEALATLRYGIMDNKGFLLLTGDVGTGKTTLINALLSSLGEDVLVASIRDPNLEPIDFFHLTSHAFGMNAEITSKAVFLIHFEQFLNEAYNSNRKVLLIIDEAQIITQKLLEEVRLLSNIERSENKLLNIFFVGQNEFNDILLHPANRPIRQRITVNYNIVALSREETARYIRHRLEVARLDSRPARPHPEMSESIGMFVQEMIPSRQSPPDNEIFTDEAIAEIHLFSKGYPRLINIICDRSLLTGFVEEAQKITADHVRECAAELEIKTTAEPRSAIESEHAARTGVAAQSASGKELHTPDVEESMGRDGEAKTEYSTHNIRTMEVAIQNDEYPQSYTEQAQKDSPTRQRGEREKGPTIVTSGRALTITIALLALVLFVYFGFTENAGLSSDAQKGSSLIEHGHSIWQTIISSGTRKIDAVADGGALSSSDIATTDASASKTLQLPAEMPAQATDDGKKPTPGVPGDGGLTDQKKKNTSTPVLLQKLLVPFPETANLPPLPSLLNLDMIIEAILPQTSSRVIITGYTDSMKDEQENRKLSESKANAIKIYLISKGLDASRIETRGLGALHPIAPNDSALQRVANNRVEVEIVD